MTAPSFVNTIIQNNYSSFQTAFTLGASLNVNNSWQKKHLLLDDPLFSLVTQKLQYQAQWLLFGVFSQAQSMLPIQQAFDLFVSISIHSDTGHSPGQRAFIKWFLLSDTGNRNFQVPRKGKKRQEGAGCCCNSISARRGSSCQWKQHSCRQVHTTAGNI